MFVRKNSRCFFPRKKVQILSRVGLVRTGQRLVLAGLWSKLTISTVSSFQTSLTGMCRVVGAIKKMNSILAKKKNCWELKSFHLATTSPIESRWSQAKLIRRQNLCESCTAHCTASKLFQLHLHPRYANPTFWERKKVKKICFFSQTKIPKRETLGPF